MKGIVEVEYGKLPVVVKVKDDRGHFELFELKAARRKLGAQLIKIDQATLQILQSK